MEKEQTVHHEKRRIKTLDSLRGFASVSVVLCHLTAGLFYNRIFAYSPFIILVQAHSAVIFFFVLSGYVLTYQYGNDPNYNYSRFLMSRFVRLYVPYIASIMLALILKGFCDTRPTSNIWLSGFWKEPLMNSDILAHIWLVTNFETNKLNSAIWSLVHEMRIGILFPGLLFITRLKFKYALFTSLVIYLIAVLLNINKFNPSAGYLNSYLYTLIFLYTFICGALIARYQMHLVTYFNKLQKWQSGILIVAGLLMYIYAAVLPHIALKIGLDASIVDIIYDYGADILVTIASAIFLIAAIANSKTNLFFEGRLSLFLGRISYSLYLVHLPVSIFVFYILINKLPTIQIVIAEFVCTFLIAIVFNRIIERPAIRLGKKLLSI